MYDSLHFSSMCLQYISCSGLVIDIKATVSESEILLKEGGFIRLSNHNVIKVQSLFTDGNDPLLYKRMDFYNPNDFRKIIVRYKRIGYNINIMRQSVCLVFNPITVNNFASLFNCTPVGRASDSMMAPT